MYCSFLKSLTPSFLDPSQDPHIVYYIRLYNIPAFLLKHPPFFAHTLGIQIRSVTTSLSRKFLDRIIEDPSVSKSNRLHVMIYWFSLFIRGILHKFL